MNQSFNPSRAFDAIRFFLPALVSAVLLGGCGGGSGTAPNASVLGAGGSALQPQATQPLSSVARTQVRSASCLTHRCIYASGGLSVNGNFVPSLGVFRTRANGKVAQVQAISGNKTGLNLPGVAVDARRNVYAAGGGTVTVYAPGSNGNVAPSHTISGANTGLDHASGIAVDGRGKIYVVNSTSVTEYAAGSNGNVKPAHTISGSRTGVASPNGIAVDTRDDIYVMNATSSGTSAVTVYAAGAHGNVTPIQTIAGPSTKLIGASGIAVDTADDIYVTSCAAPSECSLNNSEGAVLVFASGANGNVSPIRDIEGQSTGLGEPGSIAVDAGSNIYVTQSYNNGNGPCPNADGHTYVTFLRRPRTGTPRRSRGSSPPTVLPPALPYARSPAPERLATR